MDQQQQQGKLPLPTFSAEGESASAISFEAELFLTKFEDWATVCGYTNARKAKALGYALTKAASTWYQQACRRGKLQMDDWSELETAFRERFVKAVSARFIASEIAKLTQRRDESVADFRDRCVLAQTLLDGQWSIARGAADREARLEVADEVHEVMVLHHFLRHLRPEIRDKLAFCQNLVSLEDHVKAAERIEKAGTEKSFAAAAAAVPISAMQEGISAATTQKKKKRQPPPSYVCRLCGIKGHFINDCPRSDKQQRKQGIRGAGQFAQQQQLPPPQPQGPPRHLGAIPKSTQWQRSPAYQAAAIGVGGQSPQTPQFAPLQQQMTFPQQQQQLYPQLPAQDFPEMSNIGALPAPPPPPSAPLSFSEWPVAGSTGF